MLWDIGPTRISNVSHLHIIISFLSLKRRSGIFHLRSLLSREQGEILWRLSFREVYVVHESMRQQASKTKDYDFERIEN